MNKLIAILTSSIMAFTNYVSGMYMNIVGNNSPQQETVTTIENNMPVSATESAIASPTIIPKQSSGSAQKADNPILCPVDAKCGGGTTPLKKSECSVSSCCQVKSDSWKLVIGKDQCAKEQQANGYIPRDRMNASVALKSIYQDKKYKCVESEVAVIISQDLITDKLKNNKCVYPNNKEVLDICVSACKDNHPVYECINKCIEEKSCKNAETLENKQAFVSAGRDLMKLIEKNCYAE